MTLTQFNPESGSQETGHASDERRRAHEIPREPNVDLRDMAARLAHVQTIVEPISSLPTDVQNLERRVTLIEGLLKQVVANQEWVNHQVTMALSALSAMPGIGRAMQQQMSQGGQHG